MKQDNPTITYSDHVDCDCLPPRHTEEEYINMEQQMKEWKHAYDEAIGREEMDAICIAGLYDKIADLEAQLDHELYSQSKKFWREQAIELKAELIAIKGPTCQLCGRTLAKNNPSCAIMHELPPMKGITKTQIDEVRNGTMDDMTFLEVPPQPPKAALSRVIKRGVKEEDKE